jgi:membrane fusion protein, multidrug efflux system
MIRQLKSKKVLTSAIAVTLLVCTGVGYYFWTRGEVSTDDAYVDGHIFVITPRVSGYLTRVYVRDNQRVKQGDPLVALDPTPYEVALAESEANLAQSKATLVSLELGVPLQLTQTTEQVRGAEAELRSLQKTLDQLKQDENAASRNVEQLQAQYKLAKLELERNTSLKNSGAVAQQALDNSQTAYQSARAQLQGAQAKLESVKKQREAQEADIQLRQANIALAATGKEQAEIKVRQTEAQKAVVDLAKERVKEARLNLGYTRIVSPADGYVTQKKIRPGQFVSPGQNLFAVVPLNPPDIWITANFKETELTDVRAGQPVEIRVDAYPHVLVKGVVNSIMAGTGAVFSLFPPENATGNFVKVVQRIPVKITINENDRRNLPTLRNGMSVVPTIYTKAEPHGQTGNKQMDDHSRSDVADPH